MSYQSSLGQLVRPVLVSACLLGIRCRYYGRAKTHHSILNIPGIIPVPVCPEQLGGSPTPQASASLAGGDGRTVIMRRANVQDTFREDVTLAFLSGARYSCKVVQIIGVRYALLKEGASPVVPIGYVWMESSRRGWGSLLPCLSV